MVQHGGAQLVHTSKGEFHLRLDAEGSLDPTLRRTLRQVLHEGGLAHPSFAVNHEHLRLAVANTGRQLLENLELWVSAVQESLGMVRHCRCLVFGGKLLPFRGPKCRTGVFHRGEAARPDRRSSRASSSREEKSHELFQEPGTATSARPLDRLRPCHL